MYKALSVAAAVQDQILHRSPAQAQNQVIMDNWLNNSLLVARTRQGKVILHNDAELKYAFRFDSMHQLLTAEQFHLLHSSALSIGLDSLSAKTRQPELRPASPAAFLFTLFGSLTRPERLELQNLLG